MDAVKVSGGEAATEGIAQVDGTSDEPLVGVKRGPTAVATVVALDRQDGGRRGGTR